MLLGAAEDSEFGCRVTVPVAVAAADGEPMPRRKVEVLVSIAFHLSQEALCIRALRLFSRAV